METIDVIDLIEDYLCDKCDEIFNGDSIACDKVYNPEEAITRSAYVTSVKSNTTDQFGVGEYAAQIIENREKRSQCTHDVELIRKNFTKYGDVLANGLAIYITIQYITMPIKIVVGTSNVYTISANLNITVK
jgi:hypothetical protein